MKQDQGNLMSRLTEALLQARRRVHEQGRNEDYEKGRADGLNLARYYLESFADQEQRRDEEAMAGAWQEFHSTCGFRQHRH